VDTLAICEPSWVFRDCHWLWLETVLKYAGAY